jgi:hypothetical protein
MFPNKNINWEIVTAIVGILREILEILRNLGIL